MLMVANHDLQFVLDPYALLSQRQILGTGNLPQDSALVCINNDISPEMAAQSVQRNQAFCVTASDWSPITLA